MNKITYEERYIVRIDGEKVGEIHALVNTYKPSDFEQNMIERVNDLAPLAPGPHSFHPLGPKNAAVGDEIVIFSRGTLRRGRVIKTTAKKVTVAYVTPGGIDEAKKTVYAWAGADPLTDADRDSYWSDESWKKNVESRQRRIELAKAGLWQLFLNITEKTVGRDHDGTPGRHPGFNSI